MNAMTIGKLAAAGRVGVETVRFYQRRGLIDTTPRDGGIRRYDGEDLRRLRFIRHAQTASFTLDEIGELLALDATDDRERAYAIAKTRLRQLNSKICELQSAQTALAKLASACASGESGPCPIVQAFEPDG